MTAKLLPAFLECFSDAYVSIRSEACITTGNLQVMVLSLSLSVCLSGPPRGPLVRARDPGEPAFHEKT